MAIANYIRPQLIIRQVLEQIITPEPRTLNAFVFGPQYDLFRYTNATERAAMTGTAFVENTNPDPDERQLLPYEGLTASQIVDEAFTKVYGEQLEGQYAEIESHVLDSDAGLYDIRLLSLDNPNKVQVVRRGAVLTATKSGSSTQIASATIVFGGSGYDASDTFDVDVVDTVGAGAVLRLTTNSSGVVTGVSVVSPGAGYTSSVTFSAPSASIGANIGDDDLPLITPLHGRPVKVNDIGYFTFDGTTQRRAIRSIEQETTAAHYGTNDDQNNGQFAPSDLNPIQNDEASFGNVSAPANWGVRLNHTTIGKIDVTAAGSGYTTDPVAEISDPIELGGDLDWPTQQAAASVEVTSGAVTAVTLDVTGAGYFKGGVVGVNISNRGAGYSDSNPPTITVSAPTDTTIEGRATAVIEPVLTSGKVTSYKIIDPGAGYTAVPTLTLVGGNPSTPATMTAVVNLGSLRSIAVTAPGTGYTFASSVSFSGGGGSGAAAVVKRLKLISATVAAGGTGYTVGDLLTLSGGTIETNAVATVLTAPGGVVGTVSVATAGVYTALPTNPISTTGGTGTGCTLTGAWGIVEILVTTPGTGYSDALIVAGITVGSGATTTTDVVGVQTVTITADTGSGATATLDMISAPEDWDGLVEGSMYDQQYGERYTITVSRAGSAVTEARVNIRSASGAFTANSVTAYHYGLGYIIHSEALGGLVIDLRPSVATTPLKLGDRFSFVVLGKYNPLDLSTSGQVTTVNIVAAGSAYTNATVPLVFTAPPSGGTTAEGTVTISGNAVASIAITNPGQGYAAPPVVSFTSGGGSGAVLAAIITTPESSRDLTVVESGEYVGPSSTRYILKVVEGTSVGLTQNNFTGATIEVSDTAGIDAVQQYTDLEQGTEYDLGTYGLKFIFPADRISPSGLASGTQATAEIDTVDGDGGITAITVLTDGDGYGDPPEVTVADGPGSGAVLRAVLLNGEVVAIEIVSAGADYDGSEVVTVAAPITYQKGLRTGDVYYIDAVAELANGPSSVMVLSGQAADISGWTDQDLALNLFDVDLRVLFTGLIDPRRDTAPTLAWEAGDNAVGGVLLKDTLDLELTDRDDGFQWVPVKDSAFGRLFVTWRGLVPSTSADRIVLYQSESEILAEFGLDDPENPVCHAAIIAFRGAQEKPVFVRRLATDDLAGYTQVLVQAERVDGAYALCPTTNDQAVREAVAAHCTKTSAERWKMWRRAYLGIKNPGSYVVMDTDSDGNDFVATVGANANGNVRVICTDGDFITREIQPGDLFRINYSTDEWGDAEYQEFEVRTVLEQDELILVTGPASPINPAVKFEIWKPDTGRTQAEFVAEEANGFDNRRVCCVWVDMPYIRDENAEIVYVEPYFVAAEVAGLRSAVLPQQGLTYTEILHAIEGAPLMFTKYTQEDLDIASANGVFVITQEVEDGPIFIRHQLTTDVDHGPLYYEDSVGTNLDNISYTIRDTFQPYIGKRNVNPEIIEELETKFRDILGTFQQNPGGFTKIGPALIAYDQLKVAIDPVYKDRINMSVRLQLPLPLNVLDVTLRATTIQDDTVITVTFNNQIPPVST